jgi:hypothetical protein|uniref:Uncharacterized protein n=1 Tax=Synura petersenii TaxID=52555 RepID=A0A3G2QYX0_9STRA|nr:hypothetical protein [Synura petersenii]AYO28172.1 hypothetical protein [Synura petersenii]
MTDSFFSRERIGKIWKYVQDFFKPLQYFFKFIYNFFKPLLQMQANFNAKYPNIIQNIQLTFIYFFAIVDLLFSILNSTFALGGFPAIIQPFMPVIEAIFSSPILRLWASPEKVFFFSYVVIELMIVRSTFKFSKLVKYNILLIFALLMLQGLAISYWDLLFHREITTNVARWAFDKGVLINTNRPLAIAFFFNTFLLFCFGYLYLYIQAIQGKFAILHNMEWLTDSVAFWLRIKTPTMRIGKRKKRDDKKDKN